MNQSMGTIISDARKSKNMGVTDESIYGNHYQ